MQDSLTNIDQILANIRADATSREKCIRMILSDLKYRGAVDKIVRDRSGSDEDVQFVLHHTLVAFMKQVLQNRSLAIETNIYTYLNGIAKFLWLGELRKRKKVSQREVQLEYERHDIGSEEFTFDLLDQERSQNLQIVLEKIGQKCKQVLSLWAANYSMKEIADMTDYKSEGVVRKKKFQCMKSLAAYLDNHPRQKEMLK